MSDHGVPPEVSDFLRDHISSVLELELLLLLRGAPARTWTGAELAREMKIDASWAGEQLARFTARGILVRTGAAGAQYRYAPHPGPLDETIATVADVYASHRVTIIGLIFSKPTSTLKSFADAFRIRKDKADG